MHKKKINNRVIKYFESINEALSLSMQKDKSVILLALGADDPKGIFGTTIGLKEKFGSARVFDMPTAENSMTGIALGMSINGFKPVITHQRVEFSLLSMDQIINQIAKWNYMSAGKMNVPLVIRLIIGRGWGQGPQHSQSLESIFSHIPGLKVVCPSNPYDAKGMLISSIEDKNPVIFYEHRWLHNYFGEVPKTYYKTPLGKAKTVIKGKDLTIISSSFMSTECIKASKELLNYKIKAEVIDLRTLRPLDKKTILDSVKKTKHVLMVDNGWTTYGISSEIISVISENLAYKYKLKIKRIGVLDTPIPSTRSLSKYSYPDVDSIVEESLKLKNNLTKRKKIKNKIHSDIPDKDFTGPF